MKLKHLVDFRPKIISSLKNYNREKLGQDILAGVIVGIVALPLAIAFAVASGARPEQGIVTAIVAGLIISLLGGSRVQIGGPTGAFIVIIYGIVTNPQYGVTGLTVATLLAGVLLVLMGVFRLGSVIKFIPYPIIIGFTAGIAVTILATQLGDVMGLKQAALDEAGIPIYDADSQPLMVPLRAPGDFVGKLMCYWHNIASFSAWNCAAALVSIALIVGSPVALRRVPVLNKIPGSLYAIVVVTLGVAALRHYAGVQDIDTIGDRFEIQAKLPGVVVPSLTWSMVVQLMPVAFTIAMLGAIESLLSAAVADGVIGDRHNSNTELIAQGVANIAAPLFGGIPATGAIARTMTNINNGGRTPVAGIVHAVVLLLILLVLMPLASYIPMACLAGVLVVVAYNMSGWRTFRALLQNPKSDVSVLLVTFLLTIFFDLTVAIEFGLVLACLLLLHRVAHVSHVSMLRETVDVDADTDMESNAHLSIPEGVQVYEIDGPFFFGIANRFEEMAAAMMETPRVRVIRMRKVPFVDATGLHNLEVFVRKSHEDGVAVVLSGVKPDVMRVIRHTSLYGIIGGENVHDHISGALARAGEIAAGLAKP